MKYQFEWKPNVNFPEITTLSVCFLCPCCNGEFGTCNLTGREQTLKQIMSRKRPKWCPLVEIKSEF